MTPLAREFFKAARRFCDAPLDARALAELVIARMRFVDDAVAGVKWKDGVSVLIILACAAPAATLNAYRRRALAEVMAVMLDLWHGDLGDAVMHAPRRAPAPIRQYKDE